MKTTDNPNLTGRKQKTDAAFALMPKEQTTPMSVEWWQAKAAGYPVESCAKCQGLIRTFYMAPWRMMGDCGIVSKCLLCGSERVREQGRGGVPYRENA